MEVWAGLPDVTASLGGNLPVKVRDLRRHHEASISMGIYPHQTVVKWSMLLRYVRLKVEVEGFLIMLGLDNKRLTLERRLANDITEIKNEETQLIEIGRCKCQSYKRPIDQQLKYLYLTCNRCECEVLGGNACEWKSMSKKNTWRSNQGPNKNKKYHSIWFKRENDEVKHHTHDDKNRRKGCIWTTLPCSRTGARWGRREVTGIQSPPEQFEFIGTQTACSIDGFSPGGLSHDCLYVTIPFSR